MAGCMHGCMPSRRQSTAGSGNSSKWLGSRTCRSFHGGPCSCTGALSLPVAAFHCTFIDFQVSTYNAGSSPAANDSAGSASGGFYEWHFDVDTAPSDAAAQTKHGGPYRVLSLSLQVLEARRGSYTQKPEVHTRLFLFGERCL